MAANKVSNKKQSLSVRDSMKFSWKYLVGAVVGIALFGGFILFHNNTQKTAYQCTWVQDVPQATNSTNGYNIYVHLYRLASTAGANCGREYKLHADLAVAGYKPGGYLQVQDPADAQNASTACKFPTMPQSGGWAHCEFEYWPGDSCVSAQGYVWSNGKSFGYATTAQDCR